MLFQIVVLDRSILSEFFSCTRYETESESLLSSVDKLSPKILKEGMKITCISLTLIAFAW